MIIIKSSKNIIILFIFYINLCYASLCNQDVCNKQCEEFKYKLTEAKYTFKPYYGICELFRNSVNCICYNSRGEWLNMFTSKYMKDVNLQRL